jgi:hypothetical protein
MFACLLPADAGTDEKEPADDWYCFVSWMLSFVSRVALY